MLQAAWVARSSGAWQPRFPLQGVQLVIVAWPSAEPASCADRPAVQTAAWVAGQACGQRASPTAASVMHGAVLEPGSHGLSIRAATGGQGLHWEELGAPSSAWSKGHLQPAPRVLGWDVKISRLAGHQSPCWAS